MQNKMSISTKINSKVVSYIVTYGGGVMVEASTSRPWLMLILPPPYTRCQANIYLPAFYIMPLLGQSSPSLGPALTVLSANIEGLSSAKEQILAELCSNLHCDVLCLQETHRGSNNNRPSIPGMVPVIERPHDKYGSAIFVKASSAIESSSVSEVDNIEVLSVELSKVVITSIYKPPTVDFKFPHCIPQGPGKPQIIIGDFNSHSTQWGYKDTNKDGELVEVWIDSNQLSLIHDSKLPSSFNSARWKSGYDIFVTLTASILLLTKPSAKNVPIR